GCLWGLVRRFVIKPARLKNEQTTEDLIALLSILAIPILHLFKEATAIAAGHPPGGLGTSPAIAQALSNIFTTHAEGFYIGFFWAHWGIVLLILIQFGYSKHLHMLAAPANLLLRSNEPKGALKPIDIEKAESFGVAKITDFTRKHLLDGFACVSCGRCQDACPAYATEKPLNPKELIQNMKKELMEIAPKLLKGTGEAGSVLEKMVTEEILWSCTTCRNCMEICPVANEHMTKIIDMRRNLVLDKGQMPETVMGALRSMETRGHPWRGTIFSKTDWASDLKLKQMAEVQETDILFWVGCTSALDERCQKIAKSTAKILTTAGINFAILGEEESCCGDMARRVGNEYLYQMQAMKNIETLKKYKFSKILTTCPHCFNTLKYEYPQFSGNFEVVHHSQYILGLINDGKLKLATPLDKTVTYHDPCYLGRYSNIYQEPRTLISSIPGAKLVEIGDRKKRNSFCCGGGGGRSWMEEPNPKISHMRMDDAIKTKADYLAIACPLCAIMFEDAVKAKGAENLKVQDIAEIVANAI
ncbi:MAG: (Fe-S)-binding protein, partial [Chloroflexi bacterium]|nr:(Fe-S)-binding protein [Chloroflexota bacterium]